MSKTSIDGNLSFKNCKSQWNFIAFKVIKIPSLTIMRSVKCKVTIFLYHWIDTLPARTSCLRPSLLWQTSFLSDIGRKHLNDVLFSLFTMWKGSTITWDNNQRGRGHEQVEVEILGDRDTEHDKYFDWNSLWFFLGIPAQTCQ